MQVNDNMSLFKMQVRIKCQSLLDDEKLDL